MGRNWRLAEIKTLKTGRTSTAVSTKVAREITDSFSIDSSSAGCGP